MKIWGKGNCSGIWRAVTVAEVLVCHIQGSFLCPLKCSGDTGDMMQPERAVGCPFSPYPNMPHSYPKHPQLPLLGTCAEPPLDV